MKLLFVLNPVSGGIDKEPFMASAKNICFNYNIDYQIFKLKGNDAEERFNKILKSYQPDKVVSVGGDGTVLFTAIELMNTDYGLGIIPMGSANGMAKELGVKDDCTEALKDIIMSDLTLGLDLIHINKKHYMLHIGDVGINAKMVKRYDEDTSRGMFTYGKYLLAELFNQKTIDAEIIAEGIHSKESGVMLAICNGRKYGTGAPLNLYGDPMDGEFELVMFQKASVWVILKGLLTSFSNVFYSSENKKVFKTKSVEINFSKPQILQLDGEIVEENCQFLKAEIIPNAIKLITSRQNPYVKNGDKNLAEKEQE